MMTDETKHLWECEHPYYWTEGAHFANGYHEEVSSWADFIEQMGGANDDLNLVCRWDWDLDTDDDEKPVEPIGTGTLKVRYVLQRKGHCLSRDVKVTAADEPAVRVWLEQKWQHMRRLWAPFSEETGR